MSRRPPVAVADRERIISAYEEGKDFIQVANLLGVQRRTACQIVLIFKRTGRRSVLSRGGRRPHIIDEQMHDELIAFIESKPTLTLEEMKTKLAQTFPHRPLSTPTIARHLDGSLISLKLLRTVPFNWNSPEVKKDRAEYASWMLSKGVTKRLVYVDECGFNHWTARSQGRSARGSREIRMVDGQRGRNQTVCLAVSQHHMCIYGGMTKETYGSFLSELSAFLEDETPHRDAHVINENHLIQPLPRC